MRNPRAPGDAPSRHSPVLRLKHIPEADMSALRRRRFSRYASSLGVWGRAETQPSHKD